MHTGHIFTIPSRKPLCGKSSEVKYSKLYGNMCRDCFEIAQKLLRGQISINKYATNNIS